MKTKIKELLSLFVAFVLALCILTGCDSSAKSDIIGKWYNNKGKYLDIRSDGSWKLEDSYGTGTWKLLDDKITFEFTDFYGDTQESIINENELGKYIDFGHYGDFYQDAYPTIDAINQDEVFDGIKLKILGASPCYTVSVDTSNCSDFIKQNIDYSVDSGYYASGETITVYANMKGDNIKDNAIKKDFTIEADLQYLKSIEEVDTTVLNDYILKYFETENKNYTNNNISEFYSAIPRNIEILSTTLSESGFINLNAEYTSDETKNKIKNGYYNIYIVQVKNHNNNQIYNYIAEFFLYNLCKNNDGKLSWYIKGIEKEENDKIIGKCYTSISDFSRYGDYSRYFKNDNYELKANYIDENLIKDSFN